MSDREKFENYMALYWKLNGRWPDSESIWNSATAEQAEQLAIARQRISELEEINQEGIEQAERFGVKNFRQKQRIAELEKDCEILQTNLDAALRANHAQINNCEVAYKYAFSMRDLVIARDAEIERLKSAKHMIVSCADRMPTDDDADYNGQVWAMCGNEWHLLCYSNPMFADGRAKMWAATGLKKPEIELGAE